MSETKEMVALDEDQGDKMTESEVDVHGCADVSDEDARRSKLLDELLAGIKSDVLKLALRINLCQKGKDFFSICPVTDLKGRISIALKMRGVENATCTVEDNDFEVVESLHCQKLSDFKDESIMFIASVIARNTGIDGEVGDILFGEDKQVIVDSYYEVVANGELERSAALAPLNIPSVIYRKSDVISPTAGQRVAIGLVTTFALGLWIGYLLGSHFPF